MKDYDQFASEWLGRRVGDPLLVGIDGITSATMYQCVTLIKQYWVECFNLVINYPGSGAVDLWYHTPAAALDQFDRVASTDVRKGDVVILHTLGHTDATEPGHVVLGTGNLNGDDIEGLEQNGGTGGGTGQGVDEIRTRYIPKSRIAGLLRPKPEALNPQPVCSYTPETTPNRVMQCKASPTSWWNLNVFSNNINDFHAAAEKNQGDPFPIGGYATNKNFPNYRYAMTPDDYARAVGGDYSTNNGINMLDLEEIPVPYTPPAPPLPVNLAPKLTIIAPIISTFGSAGDASNRNRAVGLFHAGSYYLQNTASNGMQQISADNMVEGVWINPVDNVVPPEPVAVQPSDSPSPSVSEPVVQASSKPWIDQFQLFNGNGTPRVYKATRELAAVDFSNVNNSLIRIKARELFHAYGTFPMNGVTYVRLKTKGDTNYVKAYSIPILGNDNLPNMLLQAASGSGPLTIVKDFMNLGKARVETIEASAVEFLDDIIPSWKRKK